MKNDGAPSEAACKYAAAYTAHYAQRDLAMALRLYKTLIASHASTREAGYSRTQVQNIVNAVGPEAERLEAETKQAFARLESESWSTAAQPPSEVVG